MNIIPNNRRGEREGKRKQRRERGRGLIVNLKIIELPTRAGEQVV